MDIVLDALFYRLRNAGPWRDLPEGFGPWRTIYGWHRLWAREGLWTRMLARMARKVRNRIRLVDGTHVRVHQCAANPKGGAAAQAMSKTRGGRNSKIMALTDVRGLPVKLSLIEGQAYEGHHVIELLDDPCGLMVVGDSRAQRDSLPQAARRARRSRGNGFDDDKLRKQLEEVGAGHCFPSKSNRKKKRRLNKQRYRQRYRVENFFCRLKRWACASTRRDKLALHFLSLIQFASMIDWLRYGC
ncbi:MAG: IS5 family transposase [Prosthecobacter sp.]|nr:IS5 family transposase [Prosthecobacter sp.]